MTLHCHYIPGVKGSDLERKSHHQKHLLYCTWYLSVLPQENHLAAPSSRRFHNNPWCCYEIFFWFLYIDGYFERAPFRYVWVNILKCSIGGLSCWFTQESWTQQIFLLGKSIEHGYDSNLGYPFDWKSVELGSCPRLSLQRIAPLRFNLTNGYPQSALHCYFSIWAMKNTLFGWVII